MEIEIRSHYWPKTPELREIKLVVDGVIIVSSFMNQEQIDDLEIKFRHIHQQLVDISWSIE